MKVTNDVVNIAYEQLIRELDGCRVDINYIGRYVKHNEYGIEIHLGIGDGTMVLKLHDDTINEIAKDCESEIQQTQEALDTFRSDLECEMNIAIRTASAFKQYGLGRISWCNFKSTALSLHEKSKITSCPSEYDKFLEGLRPRVYTAGSNSPYNALLDFDGIFSALSETEEFNDVIDCADLYDYVFGGGEMVLNELYEKGENEFARKKCDAGLHL